MRIIGLIALLVAGTLVGCGRDYDVFVDNPPIGELTGTWVLQNNDVEAFDCSNGHDDPWPFGCARLVLELPNPADPDPCPHFCDAERFCLQIYDDTQPTSKGALQFGELLSGYVVFAVFSTDGDELVVRPSGFCWDGNIVTCCSLRGEWIGRQVARQTVFAAR